MLPVALGCTGRGAPPPEGQLAIENIAKWYQLYRAEHGGKPPANEGEFVTFIEGRLSQRGEPVDRNELLTSPRDGQRYVIQYGEPMSRNPELNVVIQEQEGYRGEKLIAFETARSRFVDDAELQTLLGGE